MFLQATSSYMGKVHLSEVQFSLGDVSSSQKIYSFLSMDALFSILFSFGLPTFDL